jgi:hypothetical protein
MITHEYAIERLRAISEELNFLYHGGEFQISKGLSQTPAAFAVSDAIDNVYKAQVALRA